MNGFFASMVFIGIILVIFSLICILLDKNKAFGLFKNYDAKKQELTEIISDAEEMINELNRFSDYIVNQMDLKNEEMSKNLKIAEEKVGNLNEKLRAANNDAMKLEARAGNAEMESRTEAVTRQIEAKQPSHMDASAAVAVNGAEFETAADANYGRFARDTVAATVRSAAARSERNRQPAPARKIEKVIPINKKHSEVLRLFNEGMQSLEIAKRLNMGKGEVDLILDLKR